MKPIDIILIVLIAAVLIPAVVMTVRSFTGKRSCCGDCSACSRTGAKKCNCNNDTAKDARK